MVQYPASSDLIWRLEYPDGRGVYCDLPDFCGGESFLECDYYDHGMHPMPYDDEMDDLLITPECRFGFESAMLARSWFYCERDLRALWRRKELRLVLWSGEIVTAGKRQVAFLPSDLLWVESADCLHKMTISELGAIYASFNWHRVS